MLEVESVRKRLGGTVAIDDLSFSAQSGQCVCISGENGSGKSTLLAIVAGVMRADEGQVLWHRRAAHGRNNSLGHGCAFVPEAANPPLHLTVSDLLHLVRGIKQCPAITGAERERLNLDEILGARLGELSLGQRRRACLAAALLGQPTLLVLDEPTNGLDPEGISALSEILNEEKARGALVILATHDTHFASSVETAHLVLRQGRLSDSRG